MNFIETVNKINEINGSGINVKPVPHFKVEILSRGKGTHRSVVGYLISQQRGIYNAKEYLHNIGGDLHGFNQALQELAAENINPVTIPKRFGIRRIPSLLDTFLQLEWKDESFVEYFQTLYKMSKKNK